MYYSEIGKIIEAGLDRDKEKVKKHNALLSEKGHIECSLSKYEKIIQDAEKMKAAIKKQLMDATPQTDYAALQKRCKALDYDIAEATIERDRLSNEYQEFMKKHFEDDVDV